METFTIHNPVRLHFGHGVLGKLGSSVATYGKKALLVYGKGSVKRNGIYDMVCGELMLAGVEWVEYGGIRPNPVVEDVNAAASLGRAEGVDVVLAVGGGSVIDSAKFIALAIHSGYEGWDIITRTKKPKGALPLVTVLTLAATGTEMNMFAVMQNHRTQQKLGFGNDHIYPKESFLDPSFTLSVPRDHTAYGIMDLIAHSLEAFYGEGEATLPDSFVFAVIREAMDAGPRLLNDLQDYDLRARIMYAATMALNGTLMHGRKSGDWGVHSLGHILSLLFDMPHGASLSVVYAAWLRFMSARIPGRILEMGQGLFGTQGMEETLSGFEAMVRSIGCPVFLEETGITRKDHDLILQTMNANNCGGNHHAFDDADRASILHRMYREE